MNKVTWEHADVYRNCVLDSNWFMARNSSQLKVPTCEIRFLRSCDCIHFHLINDSLEFFYHTK